MYAIRIDKTGRYIEWCNDHWYGTRKEPLYLFDREECTTIANYLKNNPQHTLTTVREALNNEFSYDEIRLVMAWIKSNG